VRGGLLDELVRSGAVLAGARGRPLHFGDAAGELAALLDGCGLADRSDLGRLAGTGPDLLDLLHRLSTQDLRSLAAGQGAVTVLTTPKGRIVARVFVHHFGERGILLVTGPEEASQASAHLRRYTLRERVFLEDITDSTCQLALVGPRARQAAARAGLPVPAGLGAAEADFGGAPVRVIGGDGFSAEGVSIVVSAEAAAGAWRVLVEATLREEGRLVGHEALEAWRILKGHPAAGFELTEEHNPLEAGLWDAVSFTKGCYVGQEVLARLRTYDKVSRELRAVVLPEGQEPPPPGSPVRFRGIEIGSVTSSTLPPGRDRPIGLAYVKKRELPDGDPVIVEVVVGGRSIEARLLRPPLPAPP
jgi:hypothetical protein